MKGKVRADILEFFKAAQYVSEWDALESVTLNDADEKQFEQDFDVTLQYWLTQTEKIEVPE